MNREIKFRAWDNQEKRIITNGCLGGGSSAQLILLEWQGGLSLANAYGLPDGTNPTFDKPVTERFEIMQWSGINDKNGNHVYEGDVLEVGDYEESKGVIVFYEGSFKFQESGYANSNLSAYPSVLIKVIGNIYENPELLTDSKK